MTLFDATLYDTPTRPRVLDLFCGGGGAGMGYWLAGYDVVGVDLVEQPDYPFEFHQGDAVALLADPYSPLGTFDVVHASPPCQAYSVGRRVGSTHPDLYAIVRALLVEAGVPWVIENVPGAPFDQGLLLCGSMFGLPVRRHRNFESSHLLLCDRHCDHRGQGQVLGVYGHGGADWNRAARGGGGGVKVCGAEAAAALGITWTTSQAVLSQAIPPAYTEYVGRQLAAALGLADLLT